MTHRYRGSYGSDGGGWVIMLVVLIIGAVVAMMWGSVNP